jgi:hypothetical protein
MLVLCITLLAFPIGIILTGIFGCKYKDLTEEGKKRYHEIEREKKRRRPSDRRKYKEFRYTVFPLSLWNKN